jgi:GNAT superfamily N-acetyltransferase
MTEPSLRLATIEDLPWIRALWRDMVTESPPAYPANLVGSIDTFTRSVALALTAEPPQAWVFLAQLPESATPDAILTCEIQQRAIGEPTTTVFVHAIYTRPAVRGRGLGSALLERASEEMLARDVAYVELTTEPGRGEYWAALGAVAYETRWVARIADGLARVRRRRETAGNGLDPVPPPLKSPEEG